TGTRDACRRALICAGRTGIHRTARLTIVNRDATERPVTELAAHARAELRIANATREKQRLRHVVEDVRVLEEKRPLLREEHFEALIDGGLRIVGLDLAEIRVQREV